jgi:hypothetical protein
VPRYVIDLFGGNRLLVTRAFDASDDAEAVANAKAMFFGDAVGRPEITSYRLRNPFPGADRIFHRGHKCDYERAAALLQSPALRRCSGARPEKAAFSGR